MEGSLVVDTSSQSVVDYEPTHCPKIKTYHPKEIQNKTGGSELQFLIRAFTCTPYNLSNTMSGRYDAVAS
jgi:hypothetical protein